MLAGAFLAAQPATDPVYDGPPIGLVNGLENEHPRLLFDAAGLEAIQQFHDSEAGGKHREELASEAAHIANFGFGPAIASSEPASITMGTWRIPTLALHHVLTGDETSYVKAVESLEYMLSLPHWSTGREEDSGMPAGNNLIGVSLGYDILYHQLDPALREALRDRIWSQARKMYYLGYDRGNSGPYYWQEDPQNNHRFHRFGGFVLGVLAAYEGEPSQDWLLSKAIEELDFVTKWLPSDGSNHEGIGYIHYGTRQLMLGAIAAQHTLGRPYLNAPYFRNLPLFLTTSFAPGFSSRFRYADDNSSQTISEEALFLIHHHRLADIHALLEERQLLPEGHSWIHLLAPRPAPAGGSMNALPRNIKYPDIGIGIFREGWESGEVAAMFKSSPFGGKRLNEYRNAHDFHYINVAHDDPDANSFVIWGGHGWVAETDRYSEHKRSSNHNTILVNGHGQAPPGANEGGQWSQPGGDSMLELAYLTNWKNEGSIALIEGEAGGSYSATPLNRFRRTFIWNEGKYILIFDDIRAASAVDVTWLMQSPSLQAASSGTGEFLAADGASQNPFQVQANQPFDFTITESTADNRGEPLGWDQLQANFANVQTLQIASLHRVWDSAISMSLHFEDADHATLTISGDDFEDVWTWTAAPNAEEPGQFTLVRSGEEIFSAEPEAWTDAIPGFSYHSADWTVSDWWGSFAHNHFPWVYHEQLGWTYVIDFAENTGGWTWDEQLGWLWTGNHLYPWLYQHSDNRWLYYCAGTEARGGQWFYDNTEKAHVFVQSED